MGTIDDVVWRKQINDYLIQLNAVKRYVEVVLDTDISVTLIEFQDCLQNGVLLGLLACKLLRKPTTEIYDLNQDIYNRRGLQYRHTENIGLFLNCLHKIGLPAIFHPDAADIFECKNIPKLIYCLRALMSYTDSPIDTSNSMQFGDDIVKEMGSRMEGQDIKGVININNDPCVPKTLVDDKMKAFDDSLTTGDFVDFCLTIEEVLKGEDIKFYEEANRLYFEELQEARFHKKSPLKRNEIFDIINKESKVFFVSVCVFGNDLKALESALTFNDYLRNNVVIDKIPEYYEKLKFVLDIKMNDSVFNYLLTNNDITDCVKLVNQAGMKEELAALTLQRWWRGILRKRGESECLKRKTQAAVTIQATWRGLKVRRAIDRFRNNPTFNLIKEFSPILQTSLRCYEKECQLQDIKSDIIQQIQYTKKLKDEIEEKDLQIGLLIQNRLTVQQIFTHPKNKVEKNIILDENRLKLLDPHSQDIMLSYQSLFYNLQTNPKYFSTLLQIPTVERHAIQDIVLTFLNYGTTAREEQLLLKVLEAAFIKEVSSFENLHNLEKSSSCVISTILSYCKQSTKIEKLQCVFEEGVQMVLAEADKLILNPMDLYHSINTKNCVPPATNEEALKLKPVQEQLDKVVKKIHMYVQIFIENLIAKIDRIPYGIKRIVNIMYIALKQKFGLPSKTILKVVGNFVFYRLFNPIIIFPEMHEIIEASVENPVVMTQRRNLAVVGKLLQYIMISKGFSEDYLQPLNTFILKMTKDLSNFMLNLAHSAPPEKEFKFIQYPDIHLITQPQVTITLQLLKRLTSFLENNADSFPENERRSIREMLAETGSFESVEQLLESNLFKALNIRNAEQQFRIACVDKNLQTGPEDEETKAKKLFVSTKELLVFLLPYMRGNTLNDALFYMFMPTDVAKQFEMKLGELPDDHKMKCFESLDQAVHRLRSMLCKLEIKGYISADDHYQKLLTSVARDIIQQSKFVKIQEEELSEASKVKTIICEQSRKLENQLAVYNEYLNSCLKNQKAGLKTLHGRPTGKIKGTLKHKKSLKYTAHHLMEKNVLISISDIPTAYYSNIVIEIVPEENPGYFLITGKWLNMQMEKISIDIRHLLHLQYQQIEEFDIFQNVTVSVAGLILLINRKFYGNNGTSFKFI